MGCCFGKTFEGEGQRLGSAGTANNESQTHTPTYDKSLDDATREQRRKEREDAAKARMEQNQFGTKKKKKKSNNTAQPLRGPNSRDTMTWTMGS